MTEVTRAPTPDVELTEAAVFDLISAADPSLPRAEKLTTLLSIVKRPPALRNLPEGPERPTALEELFISHTETTGVEETSALAYETASLFIRLSGDPATVEDEGAKAGLAVLGDMVKMYEHLFLMQSAPGAK